MTFQLHTRLKQDCLEIGRFELCRVLIMNDSHFPWFILVPAVPDVSEIYQLSKTERHCLTEESSYLAETLMNLFQADKMNIATLGNIVAQLHIHHVLRFKNDPGWPAPIWGLFDAAPYSNKEFNEILVLLKQKLTRCHFNDKIQSD